MSEPPLPPDLTAVRTALSNLAPAAPAFDRDRLMYAAGRAARAPNRVWPWTTVAFAGLSLLLGHRLTTVPPVVVERIVERPVPAPPVVEPSSPAVDVWLSGDGSAALRQRDQVLRWGVDALPAPRGGAGVFDPPLNPRSTRWNYTGPRGDV